jgi:site-specific recombinase XerD
MENHIRRHVCTQKSPNSSAGKHQLSDLGLFFSWARPAFNAGMSIFAVQKILGHRHIETTLKYAKVYDSTVARDFMRVLKNASGKTF